MQTDVWVSPQQPRPVVEVKFDPALIEHCLESARLSEQTWREFFQRNQVAPLAITYEELCTDYDGTVTRVLDFLRIKPPRNFSVGPPRTVRQADAVTEEWVERFGAMGA
jgi:LPS sulfotransferase NodH